MTALSMFNVSVREACGDAVLDAIRFGRRSVKSDVPQQHIHASVLLFFLKLIEWEGGALREYYASHPHRNGLARSSAQGDNHL